MTILEARKALDPPLRFGDPLQIEARKFLADVATLIEMIETGKISYADGEFYVPPQFWGDVEREAFLSLGMDTCIKDAVMVRGRVPVYV